VSRRDDFMRRARELGALLPTGALAAAEMPAPTETWSHARPLVDCLCAEIDPADTPCLVCCAWISGVLREHGRRWPGAGPWNWASTKPGLGTEDRLIHAVCQFKACADRDDGDWVPRLTSVRLPEPVRCDLRDGPCVCAAVRAIAAARAEGGGR
jgi:hypothetical protein